MRLRLLASALLAPAILGLGGCVAPTGPIEVTRFHLPGTAALGQGPIAVESAPGMDQGAIEQRAFQAAVGRELQRIGYREVGPGGGPQVAEVRLSRSTFRPGRAGSPVSVGVGGSTGSYGSGVGLGLGIDLSGPPPEQTETLLSVMIRDRVTRNVLWEGRASFAVRADSPLATTELAAAEMAAALFRGFPGNSGETVLVRPGLK
jgi:hypothetical protein